MWSILTKFTSLLWLSSFRLLNFSCVLSHLFILVLEATKLYIVIFKYWLQL